MRNRALRITQYASRIGIALILLLLVLGTGGRTQPGVGAQKGAPFNPHGNYSSRTNSCMSCHQPHTRITNPEAACSSCHPTVRTHQQQECATCHEPHGRTTNADLIQPSIGGQTLSFAGNNFDATPKSICRTCHTKTRYHSTTAKATHYETQDCTKCHPHFSGFSPDPQGCTVCHGNPPSGAHRRHDQADLDLNCDSCHPTVRNWRDPGHRNGIVNLNGGEPLATTSLCNDCHGNAAGIAEAKANWKPGKAIADCTGCHNSTDPSRIHGKTAPAVDAYWVKNGHGAGATRTATSTARHATTPTPLTSTSRRTRGYGTPRRIYVLAAITTLPAPGKMSAATATRALDKLPSRPSPKAAIPATIRTAAPTFTLYAHPLAAAPSSSSRAPAKTASTSQMTTTATTSAPPATPPPATIATPATGDRLPHYEGQDCAACHKHETDGDPITADAFMPQGTCMDCHKDRVDNGDGVPAGGRPGVAGDFNRRTHHLQGDLTDARCLVCHDQRDHGDGYIDLKHPDGGDNLRFINADQADLTPFCQACHDTDGSQVAHAPGGSARDPFAEGSNLLALQLTSTHSNRDFHGRQEAPFRTTCNDCHSSHGSDNLAIISQSINGNTIAFLSRTGKDSFDDPAKDDRNDLCVTCHLGKTSVHPGGDHRPAGDLDLRGSDCTTCHLHDADRSLTTADAFMPSCNACHGNPPPPASSSGYVLNETLTPHQKHGGNGPGEYGMACSACHNRLNPAYTGHVTQPASFQDVFFDSPNLNGAYSRLNRTCANVGCHSNGDPVGGKLIYTTPVWGENSRLSCAGCHGDQNILATGSHGSHLTTFYRDRGADAIGCYECHADTAQDNDNDAVASVKTHVDFKKQVRIDVTDLWGRTDSAIFNPTDRTCANSLCHSDGAASREQPGAPTFSTPKWGDRASGSCGTCHGITPQTLTSGAHVRHFDTSNQGPGITSCDTCHTSYADSKHANGKVNFADGQTLSQTNVCSACHSPGGAVDGVAEARRKLEQQHARELRGLPRQPTQCDQGRQRR